MGKKGSFQCILCERNRTTLDSLRQHMKKVHKVNNVNTFIPFAKKNNYRCSEGECTFSSYEIPLLVKHLQTEHRREFEMGTMDFDSEEQFLVWKRNIEKETNSKFVQKAGIQKRKDGVTYSKYFKCFRTGFYTPNPRFLSDDGDKKAKPWKRVSNKQNAMCTAYIKVLKLEHKLQVTYCKTHYPHSTTEESFDLFPMEESIQMTFMQKMSEGLPLNMIRDDILKTAPESEIPKIMNFFKTKQALLTEFKLGRYKDPDDSEALESWVVEMLALGSSSPVKVFKPKGVESCELMLEEDDLCLIIMTTTQIEFLFQFGNSSLVCVDSTVGMRTGHLEMTSLFILDDEGDAFPVAFMISNRHDMNTISLFFETIREVTIQVTPQGFMSSDEELYYSAWAQVMGDVPKKYLSTWCVEIAMRKNLKIIQNKDVQNHVLEKIRNLMYEIHSVNFTTDANQFVDELLSDPVTKKYGEFFQENYAERIELWALRYRDMMHPDSNTNLEELHNMLGISYLKCMKEKRLDRCLMSSVQVFSDKLIEREGNINRRKIAKRITSIHEIHANSLSTQAEISKVSDTSWKVKLPENSDFYLIEDKKSFLCCDLRCETCQVCIHMFTCTCEYYLIQNTICEHIHSLKRFLNLKPTVTNAQEAVSSPEVLLNDVEISPPSNVRRIQNDENVKTDRAKILEMDLVECQSLITNFCNKDRIGLVQESVNEVISILSAPSVKKIKLDDTLLVNEAEDVDCDEGELVFLRAPVFEPEITPPVGFHTYALSRPWSLRFRTFEDEDEVTAD